MTIYIAIIVTINTIVLAVGTIASVRESNAQRKLYKKLSNDN